MTDKTLTQNLTRTTQYDDPRQMAAYLKTLATEADQRMASHYRDLARSQTPPFAVARLNTPTVFDLNISNPWNGTIAFDTVDIDTGGIIDLSVDASALNLTETGWWWLGGYAILDGFGSVNADFGVYVRGNGDASLDARHNGGAGFVGSGMSYPVRVSTLTTVRPAYLTLASAGSSSRTTSTVNFAEMWALKVRDL